MPSYEPRALFTEAAAVLRCSEIHQDAVLMLSSIGTGDVGSVPEMQSPRPDTCFKSRFCGVCSYSSHALSRMSYSTRLHDHLNFEMKGHHSQMLHWYAPMISALAIAALLPITQALYINGSVTAPCASPLYCHGQVLKEIQLAGPYEDSKTFVDLPTTRPLDEILDAFNNLVKPLSNNTELHDFLDHYFGALGSELAEVDPNELKTDPTFLEHVNNTDVRDFVRQVIDIWPNLTREYDGSKTCTGCLSSFIPLNRTFIIAGGRFREPYYWDSYWIILGLLRTQGSFTQIALNIIENFLDLVDSFGFVPNGARQYYLNRSQPPVLTEMVRAYVEYTNDTSILQRALPTLEKEHRFWMSNRTVEVNIAGKTYQLNRYAVQNNQPRPESYSEDYHTATNESYHAESGKVFPATFLNDLQIAQLYSDLASGAESGWDYSSRWVANPQDAIGDNYFPLRSLNTANVVPVDLNSILYANEATLAHFYNLTGDKHAADSWARTAANRSEAMTDVFWDDDQWAYFDYNLTSKARQIFVTADQNAVERETKGAPPGQQIYTHIAQFYPFWTGAAPGWMMNNASAVLRAYERIESELNRFPGVPGATNLQTGEQWDEPNVWPPLTYILIEGLLRTQATCSEDDPNYIRTQELALRIARRYVDSAFCTWRTTGGSTDDLTKLFSVDSGSDHNGAMFEKYKSTDITAFGGGGEYEVQLGFGWSNGVLIWAADKFGDRLQLPACEKALEKGEDENSTGGRTKRSSVIPKRDAQGRHRGL